jgi:hypothetical protein
VYRDTHWQVTNRDDKCHLPLASLSLLDLPPLLLPAVRAALRFFLFLPSASHYIVKPTVLSLRSKALLAHNDQQPQSPHLALDSLQRVASTHENENAELPRGA